MWPENVLVTQPENLVNLVLTCPFPSPVPHQPSAFCHPMFLRPLSFFIAPWSDSGATTLIHFHLDHPGFRLVSMQFSKQGQSSHLADHRHTIRASFTCLEASVSPHCLLENVDTPWSGKKATKKWSNLTFQHCPCSLPKYSLSSRHSPSWISLKTQTDVASLSSGPSHTTSAIPQPYFLA